MAIGAGGVDLGTLQNVGAAPHRLAGRVTFVEGTTGAIGQHVIFYVTGLVELVMRWDCHSSLGSGGAATISFGSPTAVDSLCLATVATDIDGGWYGGTDMGSWASGLIISDSSWATCVRIYENTIIADIGGSAITGGALRYYLEWKPISPGATVTLSAELTAI